MARATEDRLQTRLISAGVGIPALLLAIWAGGYWTSAVAALAALLAVRELGALLRGVGLRPLQEEGAVWGAAVVLLAPSGGRNVLLALATGAVAVLIVAVATRRSTASLGDWMTTLAAMAYATLPLTALVLLREGEAGVAWLLVAFFATFATDTGAYAVGRLAGRHALAPRISPGKTWEGAGGGLVAGTGAAVALVAVLGSIETSLGAAVLLGLGIALAAQAGDLAESALKRRAGAKDSGTLIPGHGGLLDRMDSLIPVFPLVYAASRVWPAG